MTTLEDLRQLLRRTEDEKMAAGLRAFIKLAESLDPRVSLMSKIQRSFLDLGSAEKVAKARSFDEIEKSLSSKYKVRIEPV